MPNERRCSPDKLLLVSGIPGTASFRPFICGGGAVVLMVKFFCYCSCLSGSASDGWNQNDAPKLLAGLS